MRGTRRSCSCFVVIPFWTSFLIRTYAWLIILDPEFPIFRLLHVDLLYSRPAVYIGVAYNYLPLMVLPLYAALERIDWSLVEAAQDLGDTPLRVVPARHAAARAARASWRARCSSSSRSRAST